MTKILEGIKVIEMGHVVAVPAAGAMLADWGADVIKIEPLEGELIRGIKKSITIDTVKNCGGNDVHWVFQYLNRNKKSLALDLKKEAGYEILHKLVERADIFVSNYQLSSLQKLKLDYTNLSRINPKIVYGVLTGYGVVGPDKDERGFDYAAAWARTGAQHLMGEPDSPPPPQRPGMMDRVVGAHVVGGVLAALLYREKTGRGQELQFSLYQSGIWTLAEDIQAALIGTPLPKHSRTKAPNPLWNTYRTKDGRWLQLVMLQSDLQWPGFCRALARPELENDPRFSDMDRREENCEELIAILDTIFASKDAVQWEKRLRKFDCIYGRIATPMEVVNDPQAIANDFFPKIPIGLTGEMQLVMTPVKFCQNPASIMTAAPEVGQHTEDILLSLGYNWSDISRLKEDKTIL